MMLALTACNKGLKSPAGSLALGVEGDFTVMILIEYQVALLAVEAHAVYVVSVDELCIVDI